MQSYGITREMLSINWKDIYRDALNAYNSAIGLNPGYAKAWKNKGEALKAIGRAEDAKAALAKASELRLG